MKRTSVTGQITSASRTFYQTFGPGTCDICLEQEHDDTNLLLIETLPWTKRGYIGLWLCSRQRPPNTRRSDAGQNLVRGLKSSQKSTARGNCDAISLSHNPGEVCETLVSRLFSSLPSYRSDRPATLRSAHSTQTSAQSADYRVDPWSVP